MKNLKHRLDSDRAVFWVWYCLYCNRTKWFGERIGKQKWGRYGNLNDENIGIEVCRLRFHSSGWRGRNARNVENYGEVRGKEQDEDELREK